MKTLTAEYDIDTGAFWVTTRLNGRYLGGMYRDAEEVESLGFSDRGGCIRLPPLLLAPLLLGYRSYQELAQAHHDVSVGGELQYLVDVLFPKVSSFIYTIY